MAGRGSGCSISKARLQPVCRTRRSSGRGQANGYTIYYEPDVMEDQGNNSGDYGSAFWIWYGPGPFSGVQAGVPRKTFPSGWSTRTAYHNYGIIWVPAKSGVRGYIAYTFDDVEYQRVTWDQCPNRNTLPPPPPTLSQLGGNVALAPTVCDMDWRHFYLLMGSGTVSPIQVLSVTVWQANANNNLTK